MLARPSASARRRPCRRPVGRARPRARRGRRGAFVDLGRKLWLDGNSLCHGSRCRSAHHGGCWWRGSRRRRRRGGGADARADGACNRHQRPLAIGWRATRARAAARSRRYRPRVAAVARIECGCRRVWRRRSRPTARRRRRRGRPAGPSRALRWPRSASIGAGAGMRDGNGRAARRRSGAGRRGCWAMSIRASAVGDAQAGGAEPTGRSAATRPPRRPPPAEGGMAAGGGGDAVGARGAAAASRNRTSRAEEPRAASRLRPTRRARRRARREDDVDGLAARRRAEPPAGAARRANAGGRQAVDPPPVQRGRRRAQAPVTPRAGGGAARGPRPAGGAGSRRRSLLARGVRRSVRARSISSRGARRLRRGDGTSTRSTSGLGLERAPMLTSTAPQPQVTDSSTPAGRRRGGKRPSTIRSPARPRAAASPGRCRVRKHVADAAAARPRRR